jgi:hypothetical protein
MKSTSSYARCWQITRLTPASRIAINCSGAVVDDANDPTRRTLSQYRVGPVPAHLGDARDPISQVSLVGAGDHRRHGRERDRPAPSALAAARTRSRRSRACASVG